MATRQNERDVAVMHHRIFETRSFLPLEDAEHVQKITAWTNFVPLVSVVP